MKRDPKPALDAVATTGPVAVGYVRVATFSQADPRSGLNTQTAKIQAVPESEGIELVRVFEDAGESAHNQNRPGLLALLAAAEAGLAGVIIVPDLSRLARGISDLQSIMDTLDRDGVRLVSASEPWVGGV